MGADFVFAATPAPINRDGSLLTSTERGGFGTQIVKRLRKVTDIAPDFIENFFGFEPEDVGDSTYFDYIVGEILTFICEWSNLRSVDYGSFDTDRKWIVTGGMTWGDDPSDCYMLVAFIQATHLFDEPFD